MLASPNGGNKRCSLYATNAPTHATTTNIWTAYCNWGAKRSIAPSPRAVPITPRRGKQHGAIAAAKTAPKEPILSRFRVIFISVRGPSGGLYSSAERGLDTQNCGRIGFVHRFVWICLVDSCCNREIHSNGTVQWLPKSGTWLSRKKGTRRGFVANRYRHLLA